MKYEMKRTTIFAEQETWVELRKIARRDGRSVADLIREAVRRLIALRQRPGSVPSLLGVGRSGRRDVASKHEELLWKTGRSRKRR